ncbi:FimV/HubP family polar landmark protein [Undibacterium fentianense]|uniref:FimV family protein n=1 Tax=Undibacterium fentianense TaxID=2828728 RepID=A0A941E3G3_9BURK|nr:FimV/HubP family polar landmark protein [Undibacterium fentianense]MBR7800306.1 FimV family protein [Undibacterium fentianense]
MHNYKRLPISFLGRKALKAAALSSLLVISNAYATGLGKLTVLSSLGQPLRAEIELTSPNKEEINSLVPKVASIEAFRQANIEFNPALLSLRFAVEQRGSSYVIRVTSTQPMNEPWVDFLLEMNASNGKLVREYTFLLDPAELANGQTAQIANPSQSTIKQSQPIVTPIDAKEKDAPTSNGVAKRSLAKNTSTALPANSGDARQYRVKQGDTLMRIASANLNGVSLDQMLVSIYRANPQAFVGDNMNRLKAGQILTIPDAETARANSQVDSHLLVQTHSANFNAYRNKLAGQVLAAPVESTVQKRQATSGSITTKVKEVPTAANEALDKLKLSKVADAKKTQAKGITEEDRIAKDKALADANARVKELEKNVSELNKLLAVPAKPVASPVVSASKASEIVASKPSASAVAAASSSAATSASQMASNSAVAKNESASASAMKNASVVEAVASASAVVQKPKKPVPLPPPPPVQEESSWFDSKYLIAAGLLAALGGAIGVYSSRKKKESHQFEDSILTGSSLKANSMFGSTGGQSVDTNNSVFNSNFAPSASQLDANEVDPVAEADVYIAYGRDSQAEEILKEALRTQPDRHAVRLKLLEIYFGRKDLRSFELFAGELYGMTRGEGDEWGQAASMGISLDPNNPLYAGASAQIEAYAGSGLGQPTQPLEDLDPEALLENSLSEDMLDSISVIDTASALSDEGSGNIEKAKAEPAPIVEDLSIDQGLDFDLDISEKPEEEFPLTLPEIDAVSSIKPVVEDEPMPAIDFGSIDFDLDSDTKSNPAETSIEQNESLEAFSLEEPSLLQDQDGDDEIEIGSLDFELSDDEDVGSKAEPLLAKNEVGLNFGLDENLGNAEEHGNSVVEELEDNSPYNAEMATKLDLAVAYREIGDKEGARELLDEVLKGGSKEQVEKARQLLEELN